MFKPGDKVVCVDNKGIEQGINIGDICTVKHSDSDFTVLEDYENGTKFFTCRFVLAKPYILKQILEEADVSTGPIST